MSNPWTLNPGWLAQSALGGGLLLFIAWAVMRRDGRPARRHFLGALGVAAALLAAALGLGPRWVELPFAWPQPQPVVAAAPSALPAGALLVMEAELEEGDSLVPLVPAPNEPVDVSWLPVVGRVLPIVLALGWAGGACFLLGRWLLGHFALMRILRAARPAPRVQTRLFAKMARSMRPTPRLLVSDRVAVPFSCGLFRPTVVLTPELCAADEARLRWVFAHELTHLERRDAWTACLFGLAQALYFYVPWFWWLRQQVRLCQEYIADAAAVRQAGSAEDYAQFLLSLTRNPPVPVGASGVTGNTSELFRRVSMLLESSNVVENRCGRLWSAAATAGLLALAVLVSAVGLRAEATPEDDKKPASRGEVEVELVVLEEPQNNDEKVIVITTDGKVLTTLRSDGSPKEKKNTVLQGDLPKIALPDVEELIKKLPAGLTEEQIKQFREQMMKARADMQKAMEKVRGQLPGVGKEARKDIELQLRHLQDYIKTDAAGTANIEKLMEDVLQLKPGQREIRLWTTTDPQGKLVIRQAAGQGRLGIRVDRPSDALAEQLDLPKGQGLVITDVVAGSAAEKAGLKANDILLSLDGKTIANDADALAAMVKELKASTPINAVVLRKGKRQTIQGITLLEAAAAREVRTKEVPAAQNRIFQVQPAPGQGQARIQVNPRIRIADDGTGTSKSITMNVTRNNDNFTAIYQEDKSIVTVTGTIDGGKAKANSIEVKEGEKTTKYDSVEKVPQQQRERVKKLLDALEKGGGKIEIQSINSAVPTPAIRRVIRPAVPAAPVPAVPPVPPAPPASKPAPAKPAGRDILLSPTTPSPANPLSIPLVTEPVASRLGVVIP